MRAQRKKAECVQIAGDMIKLIYRRLNVFFMLCTAKYKATKNG